MDKRCSCVASVKLVWVWTSLYALCCEKVFSSDAGYTALQLWNDAQNTLLQACSWCSAARALHAIYVLSFSQPMPIGLISSKTIVKYYNVFRVNISIPCAKKFHVKLITKIHYFTSTSIICSEFNLNMTCHEKWDLYWQSIKWLY